MNNYRAKQVQVARKRAATMRKMRAKGQTFEQIAQHYGLSRQRVHQILTTYGEAS